MTTSQSVVAGVLWAVTLGQLALVLLNYRLIDRLYSSGSKLKTGGLKPGIEIPPINVITEVEGSGAALLLPEEDRYLLAFVSLDCDGCLGLLKTLADRKVFGGFAAAVVVEGVPQGRSVKELPSDLPIYVAHSGFQLRHEFGITVVPLLYVMRDKTVLATGAVSNERELRELLAEADANDQELMRSTDQPMVVHQRRGQVSGAVAGEMSQRDG